MKRFWTPQEIAQAKQLLAEGLTFRQIGEKLDRPMSGVRDALYRHSGTTARGLPSRSTRDFYDAYAEKRVKEDAEQGSLALKNAIADAYVRYANDNGVDMATAMNALLCGGMAR